MTLESAVRLIDNDSGLCEVLKHTCPSERDLIFAARGEIMRRRIGRGCGDAAAGDRLITEAGAVVFRHLQAFPCRPPRTRTKKKAVARQPAAVV